MVSLVVFFFSINEAISCLHCKLQSLLTTLPDQRLVSLRAKQTNVKLGKIGSEKTNIIHVYHLN